MDNPLSKPMAKIYTSGPQLGRSKPRLRLLSMRPNSRTTSILPDYNTVQKLDGQLKPVDNASVMQISHLSSDQQPVVDKNSKSSRLSRFVKRFSMTFISSNTSLAEDVNVPKNDVIDKTEEKENSSGRFDFNHWRRRKSLGRPKYCQPERDRSPLCAVHSNKLDTPTSYELPSDEIQRPSVVQSPLVQDVTNTPLGKLVSKRRTSLSRWFPHSVKQSRHSIKITSASSPPSSMVVSPTKPVVVMTSASKRIADQQEDCNRTMIEATQLTTKKIRKSYFSNNNHSMNSFHDTMSDLSKLRPELPSLHHSSETVLNKGPNNRKLSVSSDMPAKLADSPLVSGSMLSSSFSDSQSSFDYQPNLSQVDANDPKSWLIHSANAADDSIYQRCYSSSGTSMFSDWETENMDPFLATSTQSSTSQTASSNSTGALNRERTLQQRDVTVCNSSSDQGYLSENYCQSLSKSPIKLANLRAGEYATVNIKLACTGRLRNSVNRANRKRILMAGTTLFNRNPTEGLDYLVKHGIIVYHPVSIARFLYSDQHLNRQAIGEYFGQISDVMSAKVLREFLNFIDMKGLEVDEALRSVLSHFHPSGESQKIAFLMQEFQDVYVTQNSDRVCSQFQNPATIEVLAYSVLLLHTDLHNPNVRRLGKRMSQVDFIMNNRGIDSDHDIQTPILEGIYRRISETQFKTLPDPSDRMRVLDTILTGHLKTENFVQRHRRFIGWAFAQQLEKISSRRLSNRSSMHWRYLFTFNDILIIAKPTNMARVRPDHVLNKAAHAAITDIGSLRSKSSRLPTERHASLDSSSLNSDSSDQIPETSHKVNFSSEPCADIGPCHVKKVLPLLDLRVLVFETQCYRHGVQLCSSNGPVASFNLLSRQSRQQLVNWLNESIAEMQELQLHQKQLEIKRSEDKLNQGTLKPSSDSEKVVASDSNLAPEPCEH